MTCLTFFVPKVEGNQMAKIKMNVTKDIDKKMYSFAFGMKEIQ